MTALGSAERERAGETDPVDVYAERLAAAAPPLSPGQLRRIGTIIGSSSRGVPVPRRSTEDGAA